MYRGHLKSALARVRRELKKLDLPLGKVEGRYSPYGNEQKITAGLKAHQVGCSRTISVYFLHMHWHETDQQRDARKQVLRSAIEALRAVGLPFDDKGYMDCEFYQ